MTSQRQQPAVRRKRSIRLCPRAIVKPLIRHDKVNADVAQRLDAFCRSIGDRLFVEIEARVDEDWKAGLALKRAENIVIEGIVRQDNLRPSRRVQHVQPPGYERAIPDARPTLSSYTGWRAD